jgi:hypothetical protein
LRAEQLTWHAGHEVWPGIERCSSCKLDRAKNVDWRS